MSTSGASEQKNNTLSGIIATLVPVALVAGVTILAFLVLRKRYRRQYEPRTMGFLREQYVNVLSISN